MNFLEINVNSLYSSINRMSENSGRVKSLFLPFVGIVFSAELSTIFLSQSDWVKNENHCYIFGAIMSFLLIACSIIFASLDTFYLKYGRKYRAIYRDYCLPEDGLGRKELLDIASLQNKVTIKKRPAKNSVLFYSLINITVIVIYYIVVITIFHLY